MINLKLHRSGYILLLGLIYIGLALFSWVVTCYVSFRPITADRVIGLHNNQLFPFHSCTCVYTCHPASEAGPLLNPLLISDCS
jgi:hypothetical protein